jgi:enamine deaminase RidA (YjgF/YER057c/UK114 family)
MRSDRRANSRSRFVFGMDNGRERRSITIEGQDIEGVKLQKSARSRPSCGPSCCGGGLSRPVHLRHSQQCLLYELHFNGVPAMPRTLISSGSYLEPEIGFSRAVRVGQFIAVAGTAPIAAAGATAALGDAYGQTIRCLEIIREAVAEAGGTMANIIRTRIMLTEISNWRDAARAHGEVFRDIRPACTFVQVSGFIDPAWLVEIEADCVVE